ncbi:MAG TPA: SRPBCC family protein [candidate division Zixibacteria bacterium]|nr:SRPBCC family protein [candidate division Zixibacteria bacterium]
MKRVQATARIPAPPDELFAFLADPANLPEWQSGIVSAERTSPDPVGVGSTARVVRDVLGRHVAADLTITDYQPGRLLGLRTSVSGVGATASLELDPAGGTATDLRFVMEIRAENIFMAPVEGMVADGARQDIRASLERLTERFRPGPMSR